MALRWCSFAFSILSRRNASNSCLEYNILLNLSMKVSLITSLVPSSKVISNSFLLFFAVLESLEPGSDFVGETSSEGVSIFKIVETLDLAVTSTLHWHQVCISKSLFDDEVIRKDCLVELMSWQEYWGFQVRRLSKMRWSNTSTTVYRIDEFDQKVCREA